MKIFEHKLKRVLTLLEKQVEADVTDKDMAKIERMAKSHVRNENKILALQEQIDVLLNQQVELEGANAKIKEDIVAMIGDTKNQVLRFGKILVEFQITRTRQVAPNRPQWKEITLELQRTYDIEDEIIEDLQKRFNNVGKVTTKVDKELMITKESKQLKENVIMALRNIWVGFRTVFRNWFNSFSHANDHLEQLLKSVK